MQCPDFLLLSKFVFSSEWEYPAQQHATYAIVYSALFPWAEIVLFWLTFPYIYFYPSLHALLYCALLTDISMAHRPTAFTGPTLTQPLSLTPTLINDSLHQFTLHQLLQVRRQLQHKSKHLVVIPFGACDQIQNTWPMWTETRDLRGAEALDWQLSQLWIRRRSFCN